MHACSIALIAAGDSEAARLAWWQPLLAAWPTAAPPPAIELITTEDLLSRSATLRAAGTWDAAVLAPEPHSADTRLFRVADLLQQALVPTVILTADGGHRLDTFHNGNVLAQSVNADPRSTAGMIFALAQRQPCVRQLDQNLRMAQSFHGETAAAIDQLHQELLLAARVQRDFLPKHMPVVDGLDSSVLFRPAGFVSGDTYDVSCLDDHHVGFFLADAMGHGVPAALMTLYIAGSIPRKEIGPDGYRLISPAESLRRLNAELADSIAGPARFATAVCGLIDIRTGLISVAAAGHPPPLRIGPHGVKPVDVSGMLLGVVPDFDYQQVTIRLEPDEILLIHSDGIEHAFGQPGSPAPTTLPSQAPSTAKPIPNYFEPLRALRQGEARTSLTAAMECLAVLLDGESGSLHQDDDLTVLGFQTTSRREPTGSAFAQNRGIDRVPTA